MSERIDHVAEARLALEYAMRDVSGNWPVQTGEYKADIIAQAQVHATLALVEQQRIANLIALGQYRIVPTDLARHRTVIYTPPAELGADDWPLRDDIREGLRL